jgi:hypothetical protein
VRKRNTVALLLVGAFFLCVYLLYLTLAPLDPICSSELLKVAASPSRINRISAYRVNCGATTGFAYVLTASAAGEAVDPTKDYFFSKSGQDDIEIAWKDENDIIVRYGESGKVFRSTTVWRTYSISYNPPD